jgi:hypothetical protein
MSSPVISRKRVSSFYPPIVKSIRLSETVRPKMYKAKRKTYRKRMSPITSPFGQQIKAGSNPPPHQLAKPMFRTVRLRNTSAGPFTISPASISAQDQEDYGVTALRYKNISIISIKVYEPEGGKLTLSVSTAYGGAFLVDEGTPGGVCSSLGYMLPMTARTNVGACTATQVLFSIFGEGPNVVADVYVRFS